MPRRLIAFLLGLLALPALAQTCGSRLFVSGWGSTVHVFDACTGAYLRNLDTPARLGGAMAVRLGPDGLIYAVAETSGVIRKYRNNETLDYVGDFAQVPGIGARRVYALLRTFKSATAVLRAPVAALTSLPGFGRAAATAIRAMRVQDGERMLLELDRLGAGVLLPDDPAFPKPRALEWISSAARAVATYYGRFPVDRVRVLVIPLDGRRVGHGTTFGYGGAAIRVAPETWRSVWNNEPEDAELIIVSKVVPGGSADDAEYLENFWPE